MPSSASPVPGEAEDVASFLKGRAFGPEGSVRRIDTHAASIFLTGQRAWKLKRPVRFGYLDFSTAPQRRAALEAELRLNRRTAPGLYIGVHAITRDARGVLAIDGQGEAVDWLLEMHRFDDDALLDDRARRGEVDTLLMMRLASHLERFHAAAQIVRDRRGAARIADVIAGNAASFADFGDLFAPNAVATLSSLQRKRLRTCAAVLDSRAQRGRVRHCHGDLHLANIAMIAGEPTPFDCLEFDPALATIDTLYDLAFLLMDLWHRGLRSEANALFNRYLDLSGGDEDGVAAMPLFLSLRASIRAHVAAARSRRSGLAQDRALASDYFALAGLLLVPVPPSLIAVGGRSGTGKSTVARAVAVDIGVAPGARILRSDVLRKRIAGVAPEQALAVTRYTPDSAARVYACLAGESCSLLAGGSAVIIDAAFLAVAQRQAIEAVAASASVRFVGLWLQAGEAARIARVRARGTDASDADARVVRLQSRRPTGPLDGWRRIAAGRRRVEDVVRSALTALHRGVAASA